MGVEYNGEKIIIKERTKERAVQKCVQTRFAVETKRCQLIAEETTEVSEMNYESDELFDEDVLSPLPPPSRSNSSEKRPRDNMVTVSSSNYKAGPVVSGNGELY